MGNIVAIVTPMDEKGNTCWASLKELIDYHVISGASMIVFVGTIGESAILNHDKHADVAMMTLELADGHVPVIAGAGVDATAGAISLTRRFNDSDIVGCLTIIPYYNRLSRKGLYQHLKATIEHTDLPQILYNVPPRIGYDLLPEAVGRLVRVKNTVGTKEATGNLTRANQIKELVSDDFVLLSGNDASTLGFVQLGGHGVISVTANVAACDTAQMYGLAVEGHLAEAYVINQRLMPLHNKLFVEPSPTSTKWTCKELGLVAVGMLCLPMTPITDSGRETVKTALKRAGSL